MNGRTAKSVRVTGEAVCLMVQVSGTFLNIHQVEATDKEEIKK